MASVDTEGKFERLIALISSHMAFNGLNIIQENWTPSLMTLVVGTMVGLMPATIVYSVYTYQDSFEVLAECFSESCTALQVMTRSYFYLRQQDLCRQIVRDVSGLRQQFGAAGNERMERLLSHSVDRMLFFYRLLHIMFLSAFTFVVVPLVMPDPKKHGLPLALLIPFLPADEPYWYLHYLHHSLLTLLAIHHLAPIDGIIMVSLISTGTRIRALKLMLEELDQKIDQTAEWHQTEHLEPDLDRIIEMHISIKRLVRQINRSYHMHFFTIFGTICFIICLSLNVIALTPKNSMYPFLVASSFQLFVVCYFGNIMLVENDSLAASVYAVRWYRLTIKQQKKICFLMANAQPDMRVSAVFLPLNMRSFVTILRAAYSYFTILN